MGSPANFEYVIQLIPVLKELALKYEFVFRYICRKNFDAELTGIKTEHHFFCDDYYKILSSFDIGISPFLVENLRTKGKIAMKHQEFMMCAIPQVCSAVAISEFVENDKHVLIATNNNEWVESLNVLLNDEAKRKKLGKESLDLFNQYYTYRSQFEKLKSVLTIISV